MQKPSEASVTTAVRSLDSKVVVITPKQLAELGIDKDIKRVCRRVRKGDGAFTTKQAVSGGLLNTLRARINVLLTEQSAVTDTNPEVCENQKPAEPEVKNPRKKDIVILSNKVVHYSESEMQAMLKPTQQHVVNGSLDVKSTIRGTEPQPKSKNPNFVPDRTPENPAAEEVSSCDTNPPAETARPTSAKQSTVPCGQLIRSTFAKRFNFVKTYSKVNVISIIQKDEPQEIPQSSKKQPARIIKPLTAKMDDSKTKEVKAKPETNTKESPKPKDEAKPPTKEPEAKDEPKSKEEPKPKDTPIPKDKEDPKAKDEDPKTKDREEPKTKDEEEPATLVAPKKRGRPRKTPLHPKVDEDSEPEPPRREKPKVKETPKLDQTNATPKRRGRPRKAAAEPKPEEASSDEDSPVEKKRRPAKKAEPKLKEVSTPSTGTRTSGRKRKVVDYAALSGGRISSSEEEDFAEILAEEERNKKKTKKDKEDIIDDVEEVEEVLEEKKEATKVVKSPKIEAVHPLKKRLKMEHAQAIEKEKLEESNAEKKDKEEKNKNGDGDATTEKEVEKMDTTEKIEEKESKKAENTDEPKKVISENSTNKVNDKAAGEVPESITNKTSEREKPAESIPVKNDRSEDKATEKATEEVISTKATEEVKTTKPAEEMKTSKATEEEKTTKATEEEKTTIATDEQQLPTATEEEKKTEEGLEEEVSVKEEGATSAEIKCGVCGATVDSEASWAKHKLAQHNDLAWKVGEKPLELPQREAQSQM